MSDIRRDYSVVLWRRISEAQSAEKANRLSRSHWNSIVFNITALTERQSQGMWDFLCWWWEQSGTLSSISCGSWRYCPEYCTLCVKLLSEYLVCILFLYSVVKDSRQNIVTDQSSSWAGEALNLFLNSQFGVLDVLISEVKEDNLTEENLCVFFLYWWIFLEFFCFKSSVTIVLIKPIYWGLWKILNYLFCRKYCVFFFVT